jgi:predicted acetyltransferase
MEELAIFTQYEMDAFVSEREQTERWVERVIKPNLEDTRVLVGDDGEIKVQMAIYYPGLWLGTAAVKTPGIFAVASPPENRRTGYIRQMLFGVMHELRAAGYGTVILYPFYFPFYKKFGYEQAGSFKQTTVKMAQFSKFRSKTKGRWKQLGPDQWAEFNALYEADCKGHFGLLTRDEQWWREQMLVFQNNKPRKSYIWYNEAGEAQAYILYRFEEQKDHERELKVRDMVWLNLAAKHEILAFIANHDSQAIKVSWGATSPDFEIMPLLDDPRAVEEKIEPGYMLRILDVELAMQQRPWPNGVTGSFSLVVRDDGLEWNNLAVQVAVDDGKTTVTRLAENRQAGLSCDVRQLAQMVAGFLSPVKLVELGLLEVRNQSELQSAQRLFSPVGQPAAHMNDFF